MGMSDVDLRAAAETALTQCLDLGSEETCLIVTDDTREPIGEALYAVAAELTDDPVIVRYPPGPQHGAEPPEPVVAALREADVFLAPTTKSISHTRARGAACEAGARGSTLPGITEDVFVTGLDANYEAIAAHSAGLHEQVRDAEEIRVTSPQGTDITFDLGDREWHLDTGIVHEPGEFSNLPAGEVFVSPESASGTYVVDGTMRPH
ncbi:MAG: aminopeptidase, partial [Halohasta sp.]